MRFLFTVVTTGLVLCFYGGGSANPPSFAQFQTHTPPQALPENLESFQDAQGNNLTLDSFKGQVVLLVFWATWCGPCVTETPALDSLSKKFQGHPFKLLALSQDTDPRLVEKFFKNHGVKNIEIYFDNNQISRKFDIRGIPTAILINHKGEEVGRQEGAAPWDSPQAEALIGYHLRQMAKK